MQKELITNDRRMPEALANAQRDGHAAWPAGHELRRETSGPPLPARYAMQPHGDVAEWLRSGLQSRLHRFDSGRRLYWAFEGFWTGIAPIAEAVDRHR